MGFARRLRYLRFQVAVHLFSNISHMISKCGKNKNVALSLSLMFLPHFDVLCNLFILDRYTATWKETKYTNDEVIYLSVL